MDHTRISFQQVIHYVPMTVEFQTNGYNSFSRILFRE